MYQTVLKRSIAGAWRLIAAVLLGCVAGCDTAGPAASPSNVQPLVGNEQPGAESPGETKIGVLLVSHGSRSESWRKMVLGIEDAVRADLLGDGRIAALRSAFMEYAEPSIATQLKEFDRDGYTDVILVPLLLTVSSHSFDDIPTIIGQKQDHRATETLRMEGIEVYKPSARVRIAELLDFPDVLGKNVTRRVRRMSEAPGDEGVVLVAYGDEQYADEWTRLLERAGEEVKRETGVAVVRHAWCGHVVRYQSEPTEKAIRDVLGQKRRALVVPVLVAVDEMFQGRIIGGAIAKADQPDRIVYRHDAILPDENVERWVIDIARKLALQVPTR